MFYDLKLYESVILVENEVSTGLLHMQVVPATAIPDGWMGLDIGPDSVKTFNEALDTTKTIIWNGPMGVFEFDKFAVGTEVCKKCLALGFVLLFMVLFISESCFYFLCIPRCIYN